MLTNAILIESPAQLSDKTLNFGDPPDIMKSPAGQKRWSSGWVMKLRKKIRRPIFPLEFISQFWRIYMKKINLFFQSLFTEPLAQASNFSSVTTSYSAN